MIRDPGSEFSSVDYFILRISQTDLIAVIDQRITVIALRHRSIERENKFLVLCNPITVVVYESIELRHKFSGIVQLTLDLPLCILCDRLSEKLRQES